MVVRVIISIDGVDVIMQTTSIARLASKVLGIVRKCSEDRRIRMCSLELVALELALSCDGVHLREEDGGQENSGD